MKYIIPIIAIALAGCAKEESPVADINNGIQENVQQLIDYANNNMEMDADKQLLIQGIKDCAGRADAMAQTCEASISKHQAETSKAKAERNTLALVLLLLVAIKLFNIRV